MHLFRHEAVNYRLYRHLGDVFLYPSIPPLLVVAVPLVIIAVFCLAATRITYRAQFSGELIPSSESKTVILLVDQNAASYFNVGQSCLLGITPRSNRSPFQIVSKRITPVGGNVNLGQLDAKPLLELTVRGESLHTLLSLLSVKSVQVWSAPITIEDSLRNIGW